MAVIVHAFMIFMIMTMLFAFTHFARARGLERPAVLAGLVAYGVGALANIGAATVNGLVVTRLVEDGVRSVGPDVFAFAWALNQALDAVGVFATGAAFVFWSLDLLRERTKFARVVAGLGLLSGAGTVALLAGGAVTMNVHGALLIYTAEVAWAALVGIWILRGGLAQSGAED